MVLMVKLEVRESERPEVFGSEEVTLDHSAASQSYLIQSHTRTRTRTRRQRDRRRNGVRIRADFRY